MCSLLKSVWNSRDALIRPVSELMKHIFWDIIPSWIPFCIKNKYFIFMLCVKYVNSGVVTLLVSIKRGAEVETDDRLPLAFHSGNKDNQLALCFLPTTNNKGQNVSLFIHLVSNGDMKADRKWCQRFQLFIFLGDFLPGGGQNSTVKSEVHRELV